MQGSAVHAGVCGCGWNWSLSWHEAINLECGWCRHLWGSCRFFLCLHVKCSLRNHHFDHCFLWINCPRGQWCMAASRVAVELISSCSSVCMIVLHGWGLMLWTGHLRTLEHGNGNRCYWRIRTFPWPWSTTTSALFYRLLGQHWIGCEKGRKSCLWFLLKCWCL